MATISNWYCRFGNNLQQISNAIFYCQENKLNFHCPEHKLINSFDIKFGKDSDLASRFFFFNSCRIDFKCDVDKLNKERRKILLQYVVPHFKFSFSDPTYDKQTLLIHIRSGDVFLRPKPHSAYVPNPLSFYLKVMQKYKRIIVVTESDKTNPVIKELDKDERVEVQSNSVEEDFSTLMRAQNIVTSGVGTFAIAAALCSKNIKKLYYTDLYQLDHLNPPMLMEQDINLKMIKLENYINMRQWKNTEAQRNLMLEFKIK